VESNLGNLQIDNTDTVSAKIWQKFLNRIFFIVLTWTQFSTDAHEIFTTHCNLSDYNPFQIRDVEAVEYFCFRFQLRISCLLRQVSRFPVCFRFQLLSSKCFRFHKNLTASASLPHVLWKMLPAPQKVKCFRVCFCFQFLSSKCIRFHKNLTSSSFRFHIPGVIVSGFKRIAKIIQFFGPSGIWTKLSMLF